MSIGTNIAKYRKNAGITQETLAQKLEVTNQAVSKWESDQCCPDITLLPKLAEIFDITIDELFDRQTQPALGTPKVPWADDDTLRVVVYHGHTLIGHTDTEKEITFQYEGPALNIDCAVNIQCEDVSGNVSAGGSVACGEVCGNVHAGGSVTCDAVNGSVQAGGNVACDTVEGPASAGGSINCGIIEGNAEAGGNITCEEISGDATANGSIHCEEINGTVTFRAGPEKSEQSVKKGKFNISFRND